MLTGGWVAARERRDRVGLQGWGGCWGGSLRFIGWVMVQRVGLCVCAGWAELQAGLLPTVSSSCCFSSRQIFQTLTRSHRVLSWCYKRRLLSIRRVQEEQQAPSRLTNDPPAHCGLRGTGAACVVLQFWGIWRQSKRTRKILELISNYRCAALLALMRSWRNVGKRSKEIYEDCIWMFHFYEKLFIYFSEIYILFLHFHPLFGINNILCRYRCLVSIFCKTDFLIYFI